MIPRRRLLKEWYHFDFKMKREMLAECALILWELICKDKLRPGPGIGTVKMVTTHLRWGMAPYFRSNQDVLFWTRADHEEPFEVIERSGCLLDRFPDVCLFMMDVAMSHKVMWALRNCFRVRTKDQWECCRYVLKFRMALGCYPPFFYLADRFYLLYDEAEYCCEHVMLRVNQVMTRLCKNGYISDEWKQHTDLISEIMSGDLPIFGRKVKYVRARQTSKKPVE